MYKKTKKMQIYVLTNIVQQCIIKLPIYRNIKIWGTNQMKKFLSAVLAVIMLVTATAIPASAATYLEQYGYEVFGNYDIFDLLGFARSNATQLDVTNHNVLDHQGFNRIKGSGSSACFAPYKFRLKKKDNVSIEVTVAKNFETKGYYNGVCAFLFDADDNMYFDANDLWYTKSSKFDSRTFSFNVDNLPKGNYYLIFATGGSTVGDFTLDFTAENSVETKPVLSYTTKGDGKVKLTWTKVKGATKYRVCKLVGNKYTTVKKSTKKTSYTVTGLTAGNMYKYGIKAYVNGKWTSLSVAEAVTVQAK